MRKSKVRRTDIGVNVGVQCREHAQLWFLNLLRSFLFDSGYFSSTAVITRRPDLFPVNFQ